MQIDQRKNAERSLLLYSSMGKTTDGVILFCFVAHVPKQKPDTNLSQTSKKGGGIAFFIYFSRDVIQDPKKMEFSTTKIT